MKRILALATVAGAAALVFSSSALANSLTCGHGVTCASGKLGANTSGVGTLPFTGLDLAGIAIVAGLLLAAGLTLFRAGRKRP